MAVFNSMMSDNAPLISVIMSTFNSEKYIQEAIESILKQTYSHFEFLIRDNASTDSTAKIIRSFHDPRIIFFENDANLGYVSNLNTMINAAQGKYIARQDADDISCKYRFEKQIVFMERHPEIGACGTFAKIFGTRKGYFAGYMTDAEIRASMIIENQMVSSSMMIRKDVFHYGLRFDENFMPAEDYKMWFEIMKSYKLANLPHCLVKYRVHHSNFSKKKAAVQLKNAMQVRGQIIEYFFPSLEKDFQQQLSCLLTPYQLLTNENLRGIQKIFYKLKVSTSRQPINRTILSYELFKQWTIICLRNKTESFHCMLKIYFTSHLLSLRFVFPFLFDMIKRHTYIFLFSIN